MPSCALRPAAGFKTDAVRLRRIYVLGVGDQIAIEKVAAVVALQQLMASWYAARFGTTFSKSVDQGTHFKTCARLAKDIPMRVLRRPAALSEGEPFAAALEKAIYDDLRGN